MGQSKRTNLNQV